MEDDDRAGSDGVENAARDIGGTGSRQIIARAYVPHRAALPSEVTPAAHGTGKPAIRRTHPAQGLLGHAFEQAGRQFQLTQHFCRRRAPGIGMGIGMVAESMSSSHKVMDERRMLLCMFAQNEEGCFGVEESKDVEQGGGEGFGRTIVESKINDPLVGGHPPEEIRVIPRRPSRDARSYGMDDINHAQSCQIMVSPFQFGGATAAAAPMATT